nr:ribonuclease H-like domain-containing protein [Tanacetum cinerariifolium]
MQTKIELTLEQSQQDGNSSRANIKQAVGREFDILSLLHACTCAAHKGLLKHNQLVRLMQFLMRLNDVYQPIRSNLLARDPLPDVKDAFVVVSREESYRGLAYDKITAKTNPTTFVAKTNNGNNNFNNNGRVNSNNNSNRGSNPNLVCKHYGLIRHTIERCYELNGYRAGFKRNPNLSKQSGFVKKFNGNNVDASQSGSTSSGFMDASFTNDHMIKLLSLINEKPAANVSGSMADSKYFVGFNESKCYIQDLRLEKIMGTGSETTGLYMFDCVNNADQVLSVLKDKISFKTGDHVSACDICHKAKQTKEPFPLSDHKSVKLGELIHLGVWGPYKVTSRDGYKYFLTVVNDFSRAVWVYLLKNKSKVFDYIESFIKMIFTQFGVNIKIVRDVRFYEIMFPFKMQDLSKERCVIDDNSVEVDLSFDTISSQSPNDEEGDTSKEDGEGSCLRDYPQTEVRRSSRPKSQPVRFNDCVVSSNVKYGLEKKYCLELLSEYGLLACKPVATPLQQNTVHMHAPLQPHFNARLRVLRYLKQAYGTGV